MAKLTAAQERSIETTLYHLKRALAFIADKDTTVCRPFGGEQTPIAKDIGSNITGLQMGIDYLNNFLDMNKKQ